MTTPIQKILPVTDLALPMWESPWMVDVERKSFSEVIFGTLWSRISCMIPIIQPCQLYFFLSSPNFGLGTNQAAILKRSSCMCDTSVGISRNLFRIYFFGCQKVVRSSWQSQRYFFRKDLLSGVATFKTGGWALFDTYDHCGPSGHSTLVHVRPIDIQGPLAKLR